MIKKGLDTLACQLFSSCLFVHTVDQNYVIETFIQAISSWNEKNKKEKMELFIFSIDIGLIQYYETSGSGEDAQFKKITASQAGKKTIGGEPKEVRKFDVLVQTVNEQIKICDTEQSHIKHRPIVMLLDFTDFSFPEDWLHMKTHINMHNWKGCFAVASNRRDKVPSFMERYMTHIYLSDFIDYNKDRTGDWIIALTKTLKDEKVDASKLPFRLEDRVANMTTYEEKNTQRMIEAARVMNPNDLMEFTDYVTKIPSLELANANHVRLVIDNKTSFEHLGGLEHLKADMDEASRIFTAMNSPEIKEHKVPIPKSIILQGIQGGGKTVTAKAIANKFQARCAIFNMADIFSGRLGDTEANIRSALNTLKELAPVVVLVDEIDKAMVGMESSGRSDGGTTARAIQTYLTFLADNHDGVFLVHTANDLDRLPPEFLRRGRHDNIYFVDVPTRCARNEIFKIHLSLLGTPSDKITALLKNESLFDLSRDFTGAEIEEALKAAKRKAFIADPKTCEITEPLIIDALNKTKSICRVDPEKINKIRAWGLQNAVMASMSEDESQKAEPGRKKTTRQSFG